MANITLEDLKEKDAEVRNAQLAANLENMSGLTKTQRAAKRFVRNMRESEYEAMFTAASNEVKTDYIIWKQGA